jgi:hypothetical protein
VERGGIESNDVNDDGAKRRAKKQTMQKIIVPTLGGGDGRGEA